MSARMLVVTAIAGAFLVLAHASAYAQAAGATIRGQIVAADTGRPLRRARIIVAPANGDDNPLLLLKDATGTANTDTDGRYEISNLPEGRYRVSVARTGYLPLKYGQHRPLEQPGSLDILGDEIIDHVDFALPRMGLITGRITDERGNPIAGVLIMAMRPTYLDGRRQLASASGFKARTDDAGQYRLPELMPGTYVVMASTRETWTIHNNGRDEEMGFQPTFFPGTSDVAQARRVSVGYAEQAKDVNFSLIPARTAKISGTAVDSHGRPLAGRRVGLTGQFRGSPYGGLGFDAGTGTIESDGTFVIKNVPPGEYKLRAQGSSSTAGGEDEVTAQTILVHGIDIDRIVLRTSASWSMTGKIATENRVAPDISPDRARIIATVPDVTNPRSGPPGGKTRINADWTFAVTDLFGAARVRLNLPEGWAVKAVLRDGRDVTDSPLESKGGGEVSGVEIVVTNQVTTVAGRVTDQTGAAVTGCTVIVFGADSQTWQEHSRFVRAARPDGQGAWQIKGLPPGDYLAAAIDYVEEGAWNDPGYLAEIRTGAQNIAVLESGAQTVLLRLGSSK
jgi:hypothetical protein